MRDAGHAVILRYLAFVYERTSLQNPILGMMINLGYAAPGIIEAPTSSLSKRTGDFYSTCIDVTLDDWTLSSECQTVDGVNKISALNLKRCLVDDGTGSLKCVPEGKGISGACQSSPDLAYGTLLTTSCKSGKEGLYVTSTYDLDECIGNNSGILTCTIES